MQSISKKFGKNFQKSMILNASKQMPCSIFINAVCEKPL